jgi:hypothetical protein
LPLHRVDVASIGRFHHQLHGCCQARCAGITLDGVGPRVSERAEFTAFPLLVGNGTGERNFNSRQIQPRAGFKIVILIQLRNVLLCGSLSTDSAGPNLLRFGLLGLSRVCVISPVQDLNHFIRTKLNLEATSHGQDFEVSKRR